MFWRLNRVLYPVYNLGPGRRVAIWTQGCPLSCTGCLSPDLNDASGGKDIPLTRITDELIRKQRHFTGITITGGEPFAQYGQLTSFCRTIKETCDLDILVYSGYTIGQLDASFPDGVFRKYIDILIDGPYNNEVPCGDGVRGSSNQRILKLSMEGEEGCTLQQNDEPWSMAVSENGSIYFTGVPGPGQLASMEKGLEQKSEGKGLGLRFQ